jgi:hypothetical protein
MKILGLVLGLMVSAQAGEGIIHLCKGFAPENDRQIPVAAPGFLQAGGITEKEFNDDLDRVERVMGGDVKDRGAVLVIDRHWDDSEVNAYADKDGNNWLLEMFGGLARHPMMTKDGFIMVACHELGHHIGGAPHFAFQGQDMSNEGEADYFATTKCFRRLFTLSENQAWEKTAKVDGDIVKSCESRYSSDENLKLSCERATSAAVVLGDVLADLGQENPPSLGTPDTTVVAQTEDAHPAAQCRVDTYSHGADCDRAVTDKFSDTDARAGACEKADGYAYGFRPRCWYKPDVADKDDSSVPEQHQAKKPRRHKKPKTGGGEEETSGIAFN